MKDVLCSDFMIFVLPVITYFWSPLRDTGSLKASVYTASTEGEGATPQAGLPEGAHT